jgi:hypothetical protein
MRKIEDQIKKCIITAPEAGQVVYANQIGVRGQTDIIIQEGVRVRQYQTIIRLPDPKRMQVKTKVNESKIGLVRVGLPAKIRVDALANMEFDGEVVEVGEYPLPSSFFNSNVKDYQVIVKINNPDEQLRAGLTAQVAILARRETNVLQVPVQAVFEHEGGFYCITVDKSGNLKPVKVDIAASNDRFVVIKQGLQEGQEVVLNVGAYREKVGLTEKKIAQNRSDWSGKQTEQLDSAGGARPTALRGTTEESASGSGFARSNAFSEGGPERGPRSGEGPSGGPPGGVNPAMIANRIFERMDSNGDGKIDASEMPADRREDLMRHDANGDGAIDRQELMTGMERMRAAGGPPGGPGDGFGRPGGAEGRRPDAEGGRRP